MPTVNKIAIHNSRPFQCFESARNLNYVTFISYMQLHFLKEGNKHNNINKSNKTRPINNNNDYAKLKGKYGNLYD